MCSAVVAEIVGNERRVFHDGLTALVFTVKGTERIDLGALNAVVTHVIRMIKNKLLDLLAICRTAFSIPHGVNHEFQARCIKAQLFKELHEHDDGLGISGGIRRAKPLNTYLMKLTESSLLRALPTKHGFGIPHLGRSGSLRHKVMLNCRTHDAGGSLRTHGHTLAGLQSRFTARSQQIFHKRTGKHTEHLFAHDIGRLTNAMDKGIHLFYGRCLDAIKSIRTK